jgi:hypothetical protein
MAGYETILDKAGLEVSELRCARAYSGVSAAGTAPTGHPIGDPTLMGQ